MPGLIPPTAGHPTSNTSAEAAFPQAEADFRSSVRADILICMTREQLTAILTTTRDEASIYRSDESYIDWSSRTADGVTFEAGDADGNVVQLDLTRSEMEMLVHRLAASLLAG